MRALQSFLSHDPIRARVVPFLAFVLLGTFQAYVPSPNHYWIYVVKSATAGWLLWMVRHSLPELRWKFSGSGMATGIFVFLVWIGLDPILQQLGWAASYPKLKLPGEAWNPFASLGAGSAAAWFFAGFRVLASAVLVPMLEEIFFRSFLYRYLERIDFLSVPLGKFSWRPFVITAIVFGFEHQEWLAGILAGVAFQVLVCRKGRLGDAVTAHAVANLLLGSWVIWKGAWHFW